MQFNQGWSKLKNAGEKHRADLPPYDPLKRVPFKLTPDFEKLVEENIFNRKTP